ncbi:MAG: voltage-gated potassium channel [Oceanicoccus sp.]|jgi:voltage-gated potassium channel
MIQHILARKYWKTRYLKLARQRDHMANFKLGRLLFILLSVIVIHSLAMVYFENMSLEDALWLSITTATTVGYGDLSAASWQGRIITTVCMYIFAISLLAQLAAEFFEYRIQIRDNKKTGNWVWENMKNHLVIINTPDQNTDVYMDRLIGQVRLTPGIGDLPIQILTRKYPDGLPNIISKHRVVHYNGVAEDNESLKAVNIDEAKIIVVLAKNSGSPLSDSLTFDVLSRIGEIGTNALIAVECAIDSNRSRLKKAGASVLIRPIRAYPELLVRSISEPGTEAVMENLFTHDGDHMHRVNFPFKALKWRDIVLLCVENDFGLPLAYIDETGVYSNPPPDQRCSGNAIISLVREDQNIEETSVAQSLSALM